MFTKKAVALTIAMIVNSLLVITEVITIIISYATGKPTLTIFAIFGMLLMLPNFASTILFIDIIMIKRNDKIASLGEDYAQQMDEILEDENNK